MKRSKVKLVVVLLGTPLFLMFQVLLISASTLEDPFQINYVKQDNEEVYEILGLNSYRKQRILSEEFNNLLDQFPIDLYKLKDSEEIYVSVYKESRYVEGMDGDGLGPIDVDAPESVEHYYDKESFLSKSLIVYNRGYINAKERLFEAVSYVDFEKLFHFRNIDLLAIWATGPAIIDVNLSHAGTLDYYCTPTSYTTTPSHRKTERLEIDYGGSNSNGVAYNVRLPHLEYAEYEEHLSAFAYFETSDWNIEGNYHFIQAGSVHVNSAYIHNEKFLGGNLSIGFGPVGLSVSGGHTKYQGMGITIREK